MQTEILYGIALLPKGRRKAGLASAAAALFAEDFAGRVLPYDSQAARHYAELVMDCRGTGAPIETFDALIAATARAAGTAIATRDVGGFQGCGIAVIDPWSAATAA